MTPQLLHSRVVGRSLHPAVPRQVCPRAVPVAFTIRLVLLVIVRNQIVQREAVVAGHEIDALFGLPFLVAEDVRAAARSLRQQPYRAVVALDKVADVVAEPAIPLLPAVADEGPHLIKTGSVPRFGDQFGAGENGVGLDIPENRGIFERTTGL